MVWHSKDTCINKNIKEMFQNSELFSSFTTTLIRVDRGIWRRRQQDEEYKMSLSAAAASSSSLLLFTLTLTVTQVWQLVSS
jgi:hypothetical protein